MLHADSTWRCQTSKIGIRDRSDEMLIKWSVQDEECSETPRVGALGFRIPHDVELYAVEPESVGGRDGG